MYLEGTLYIHDYILFTKEEGFKTYYLKVGKILHLYTYKQK
jgi:hypothetical protein